MSKIKKSLLGILSVALFLSCNKTSKKRPVPIKKNFFKNTLIETQIGKSNLYVALPSDFKIEENIGPDFEVYYFMPLDTINVRSISGGFYLGNHPSKFEPNSDNCKTEFIEGLILNKQRKWRIYDCIGEFSIQAIITNENVEDWNQKIHVFGNAKSKEDLYKLIDIYSTLTFKK